MATGRRMHYKWSINAIGASKRCRYRQDFIINTGFVTENLIEVTCPQCLKAIQRLGIRPRSEFPDVPTFSVVAEGKYRTSGEVFGSTLAFTCPVCGSRNTHSGTYGKIGAGDGHRCSPCHCWERGYYIREVPR